MINNHSEQVTERGPLILDSTWETIEVTDHGLANNPEAQRVLEIQAGVTITADKEGVVQICRTKKTDDQVVLRYSQVRRRLTGAGFHMHIHTESGDPTCHNDKIEPCILKTAPAVATE